MDEVLLRSLTPSVLTILVRRGADFAAAEDAVQDALVEALRVWPTDPPRDVKGWLVTVAWRRFLDAARSESARRRREEILQEEPAPGSASAVDDTLRLYFLCAHPSLTPSSAIALTLDRRRAGERAWPVLALITAAQALAVVVVLVLASLLYASAGDGSPGVALGLAERLHLVTVALWLLAVGLVPGQWKRTRRSRRAPERAA